MDQYCMILRLLRFQFECCAPALITRLNDSNPKHQYPRGGPNRHTSRARCASVEEVMLRAEEPLVLRHELEELRVLELQVVEARDVADVELVLDGEREELDVLQSARRATRSERAWRA